MIGAKTLAEGDLHPIRTASLRSPSLEYFPENTTSVVAAEISDFDAEFDRMQHQFESMHTDIENKLEYLENRTQENPEEEGKTSGVAGPASARPLPKEGPER